MLPAGVSSINSNNGGKNIYYRGVILADLVSFIFQEKSFGVVGGLILPITGNVNVSASNTSTNTSNNATSNNNNNNNTNISNTNTNNNTTTSINLSSLSF